MVSRNRGLYSKIHNKWIDSSHVCDGDKKSWRDALSTVTVLYQVLKLAVRGSRRIYTRSIVHCKGIGRTSYAFTKRCMLVRECPVHAPGFLG